MQTMDQSLMQLLQRGIISVKEATRQASNPSDFTLRLSGISSASDKRWDEFEDDGGSAVDPSSAP
jgi:twitching motility protein PilT